MNPTPSAVACLALLGLSVPPDILPPGHKSVTHEMVVQGPLPPGVRLVAAPVRGFGGVHEVVPGEPFSFSSKYGTRLYDLAGDVAVPTRWSDDWVQKMPHSSTFDQVTSVPLGMPLSRVVTTWRLVGRSDRNLALETVDERRFDRFGNPLPRGGEGWWLPAIAVLGAAMVLALWRSRPEPNPC